MEDVEDDGSGTHANWVQHPYTKKMLRDLAALNKNHLLELFGACERTSDPGVAAAYARYSQDAVHLKLYSPRRPS